MNGIQYRAGHLSPSTYNRAKYKIIFMTAQIRSNKEAAGKNILTSVVERKPLAEVWVDLEAQTVE